MRGQAWFMGKGHAAAVVRMGGGINPYWWVLCPATSTLVLEPPETIPAEPNCSQVCEWEAEHHWADAVIRLDARGLAPEEEEGTR